MKAVVLFGSPRKEGNTIQLTSAFSDVLKKKHINVRMLYLNDMNIRPCQGCHICLPAGVCKINDDMKDIRKYMVESDLIVYASPIYWFGISAQLKTAIDRTVAFMDEKFNSRIAGKKAVTLMTCGSEDAGVFEPSLSMFRMIFDLQGLVYVGRVEATACVSEGAPIKKEFIEKTRELAESLT
ncbi:MAG: flavodoxin family protein [Syntrophorhabdaceae bacterium]|nr:flavodoxin family protein [Syntrophorhabdales bacterium]MBP9560656.1 flavodoxin family protein [Syntrophorhabdaceae bacterium]